MHDFLVEDSLELPVLWTNTLPLLLYTLDPAVGLALDVVVDNAVPLFAWRRGVDKHDNALFVVDDTGKILDEALQTMNLERRAHYQQDVGATAHVVRLQLANLVAEGMGLVVEHNGGTKAANRGRTG